MNTKGEIAMNQIQKSRVANEAILINDAGAILVSEAGAILFVEGIA